MGDAAYERLRGGLLAACLAFAALGLALAFAGSALFAPWHGLIADALYGASALPPEVARMTRLTDGILGASIAGKWVATAWLVHAPLRRRERWAANAVLASLTAWFAIDSIASVLAGAAVNVAVINLFPLVVVGGLTLAVRRGAGRSAAARRTRLIDKVLLGICALSIGTGLMAAFAIRTAPFELYNAGLEALYGSAAPDDGWVRYQRFAFGLIGGTIAGHFIALTAITWRAPGARWALAAVATSMSTWFFVDSAISALEGAWFNVWMVNVPSFAAVLVPAALAWREAQPAPDVP